MGESAAETEELRESLKKALEAYRRERPNLSLRAISKNSGVNRYFLMKLLDERGDASSLDLKQVLLLAKFVTERAQSREYEDSTTSEVRKAIQKAFNLDLNAAAERLQKFVLDELSDSYQFLVLTLARHQHGISRAQIQNLLGMRGLKVCLSYLKSGILKEINGRVLFSEKYVFEEKEARIVQRFPDFLRFYSVARPQEGRHTHLVSENINLETLKKIRKLYEGVHKKVLALVHEPESQGDISFFSLAAMTSFDEIEE